jgi:hypothetical protein
MSRAVEYRMYGSLGVENVPKQEDVSRCPVGLCLPYRVGYTTGVLQQYGHGVRRNNALISRNTIEMAIPIN